MLYVNGDSHTAAAEAVNPHAFAEDDPTLVYLGRLPHPSNLAVSWGKLLSATLKSAFKCDAESGSSNDRIRRTTRAYLDSAQHSPGSKLVIIQWSTWEREEWLIDGVYYQIGASGQDDLPESHRQKYREFVTTVDWQEKILKEHEEIWRFHQELDDRGVLHVFFNGNNDFSKIPESEHRDWGRSYIGPYDPQSTYDQWLKRNGFNTVAPESWHFGREAHAAWSRFMLQYIVKNQLI